MLFQNYLQKKKENENLVKQKTPLTFHILEGTESFPNLNLSLETK